MKVLCSILLILAVVVLFEEATCQNGEMMGDAVEGVPYEDGSEYQAHPRRAKRWTCNSYTGDFLCAGWPGAWRCQCGAACYNNVCTCSRCG